MKVKEIKAVVNLGKKIGVDRFPQRSKLNAVQFVRFLKIQSIHSKKF